MPPGSGGRGTLSSHTHSREEGGALPWGRGGGKWSDGYGRSSSQNACMERDMEYRSMSMGYRPETSYLWSTYCPLALTVRDRSATVRTGMGSSAYWLCVEETVNYACFAITDFRLDISCHGSHSPGISGSVLLFHWRRESYGLSLLHTHSTHCPIPFHSTLFHPTHCPKSIPHTAPNPSYSLLGPLPLPQLPPGPLLTNLRGRHLQDGQLPPQVL